MKPITCNIPDSIYMINSPDEIGRVLRKAFEVSGPVLIGIHVDYRDNHLLFEKVHEHLLN